jgi:acyl-CoA dehydrogenase
MLETTLYWLLAHPLDRAPQPTLADWQRVVALTTADHDDSFELPVERAVVGGLLADRLSYAFFAGYQAALSRLFPELESGTVGALCVSERGGGHPAAVQTTLTETPDGWRLNGEKTFVTSAAEAQVYLIAAKAGADAQGRARLKIVRVSRSAPGVTLTVLPPLDFVPEVSHGGLRLESAVPDAVYPEDGYASYIKPFRTVEDLHVFAASLAHLLRIARLSTWDHAVQEQILALLATLISLAQTDPASPVVHLALAGLLRQRDALLAACEPLWSKTEPETAALWRRDRKLLLIAESVREKRTTAAWERIG